MTANEHNVWFLNTGATLHMMCNQAWLHNYEPLPINRVTLSNNTVIDAVSTGTIRSFTIINGHNMSLVLTGVLHIPQLEKNLISLNCITEHGFIAVQDHRRCTIQHARLGMVLLVASPSNGMLCVPLTPSPTPIEHQWSLVTMVKTTTLNQLHHWLGHISEQRLHPVVRAHNLSLPCGDTLEQCILCIKGMQLRPTIGKGPVTRAATLMHTIHSDVCGPMLVELFSQQLYFITFINNCTRYTQVHLMHHKSEVLSKLQAFVAVHRTHSHIHILKLDHGGEYIGDVAQEWMAHCSIQHITTPTYSPEHNSVAKQYNHTIMNMVHSMLLDASLVSWFWAEALNTTVYINNHMPSRSINNMDPFQLLHGCMPNISKLQPFSCCTYILTPAQMCNKLQDHSRKAIYLGPLVNGTHHHLWVCTSSTITESHDVIFHAAPTAAPHNPLATLWIPKLKTTTITPLVDNKDADEPELLNTTHMEGDDFTMLADNKDTLSPPASPYNILGEQLHHNNNDLHSHKASGLAGHQHNQDITVPMPDPEPTLDTGHLLPLEPELQCKPMKLSTRKQNKVMMVTDPLC